VGLSKDSQQGIIAAVGGLGANGFAPVLAALDISETAG
jgi:hypothetical protein